MPMPMTALAPEDLYKTAFSFCDSRETELGFPACGQHITYANEPSDGLCIRTGSAQHVFNRIADLTFRRIEKSIDA